MNNILVYANMQYEIINTAAKENRRLTKDESVFMAKLDNEIVRAIK